MNYDKLPKRIANWLKKNREKFGTKDGLPGFYHRRDLFRAIHPGSKVMVQNCHGGLMVGKAVMVFRGHAVLNGGGPYGTPLIADASNTVYCEGIQL